MIQDIFLNGINIPVVQQLITVLMAGWNMFYSGTLVFLGRYSGTTAVLFAILIVCIYIKYLRIVAMAPYQLVCRIFGFLGSNTIDARWSIVYDAKTKQPIDPAYVTIRDMLGKEVASAVTDLDGRFAALLRQGIYTLQVQKTNYTFPSKLLARKEVDGQYHNLYFGGTIDVQEKEQALTVCIPMDPVTVDWNQTEKKRRRLGVGVGESIERRDARKWYFYIGLLSMVAGLAVGAIKNIPAYIAVYTILFISISGQKKKASQYYHSVILEKETGDPLAFAKVHVIDIKSDFERTQKIASFEGQFVCLVPNGTYYVHIDKRDNKGNYAHIYTSKPFDVNEGYIGREFIV